MDGALLMRTINKIKDGLSTMEVVFDFAFSNFNISKNLKALIRLRKLMVAATQDHEKHEKLATASAVEPVKLMFRSLPRRRPSLLRVARKVRRNRLLLTSNRGST